MRILVLTEASHIDFLCSLLLFDRSLGFNKPVMEGRVSAPSRRGGRHRRKAAEAVPALNQPYPGHGFPPHRRRVNQTRPGGRSGRRRPRRGRRTGDGGGRVVRRVRERSSGLEGGRCCECVGLAAVRFGAYMAGGVD